MIMIHAVVVVGLGWVEYIRTHALDAAALSNHCWQAIISMSRLDSLCGKQLDGKHKK